jgi:arabinose-5-phosphate isomerase
MPRRASSPRAGTSSASREVAKRVLQTEASAILGLVPQLDASFDRAVELLAGCKGRVIVTGMGKSGIIAHKISATLSSTGTPAIFLHAAEAVHGDLGVIQAKDVVIALSHSGEGEVDFTDGPAGLDARPGVGRRAQLPCG